MGHTCPLCSGAATKKLFVKEEISYYTCNSCRFEFSITDNNANLENSLTDFETCYLQYFDQKDSDQKNHETLLKWITKYLAKRPATFLDIGCGSGKWVDFLEEKGYEAIGIEPSDALYKAYLSGKQCFYKGTSLDYYKDNPKKQFDVVTAFDVLEHIKDPLSFLHQASLLMHNSSLLFMSTPDVSSWHRKLSGKMWHYFNKYHFSYFSKATLEQAAGKSGLTLLSTSHQSRIFQTGYILNYFKNFVLKQKSAYPKANKGLLVSLNLYDNMYCVLKKDGKTPGN